ncbi:MAG TPA: GNAT family N-acetyltransferase, partial [Nakamurella sp.]
DAVHAWFTPEDPGPVIFSHVRHSGIGRCMVDRWPDPRAVLVESGGNYDLRGNPEALADSALDDVAGFVQASSAFEPLLRRIDPGVVVWDRVIAVLPDHIDISAPDPRIRRLTEEDAAALAQLPQKMSWISRTWGGPAGLAASQRALAAHHEQSVVSVAVPFFVGERFEDLGVVTHPEFRRQGLSRSCAAAVIADVRSRGHTPTWTTSPDNAGSLAVAERLGFQTHHRDVLWAIRTPIPRD